MQYAALTGNLFCVRASLRRLSTKNNKKCGRSSLRGGYLPHFPCISVEDSQFRVAWRKNRYFFVKVLCQPGPVPKIGWKRMQVSSKTIIIMVFNHTCVHFRSKTVTGMYIGKNNDTNQLLIQVWAINPDFCVNWGRVVASKKAAALIEDDWYRIDSLQWVPLSYGDWFLRQEQK